MNHYLADGVPTEPMGRCPDREEVFRAALSQSIGNALLFTTEGFLDCLPDCPGPTEQTVTIRRFGILKMERVVRVCPITPPAT